MEGMRLLERWSAEGKLPFTTVGVEDMHPKRKGRTLQDLTDTRQVPAHELGGEKGFLDYRISVKWKINYDNDSHQPPLPKLLAIPMEVLDFLTGGAPATGGTKIWV